MKISSRLEVVLYNRSFPFRNVISSNRRRDLHSEDINTRFIRTVNEGNSFIVPVTLSFKFVDRNTVGGEVFQRNIVSPLCVSYINRVKSVDSIIINMLKYSEKRDYELLKVVSDKHGTYYGSEGLLLDSNFNILLMNAYHCIIDNNEIIAKGVITYVNPRVALGDNSVDKYIYNKILPTYLNNPIYTSMPDNSMVVRQFPSYAKPSIIFEDVTNKFLAAPTSPKEDMHNDIYKLLDNNLDEIVNKAVGCL